MKTRKLVYGAMIASLFGVVSLLNSYTAGTFDALIGYFMVIPFAWYGYQYSLKDNLIVAFASVMVVLFTGIPTFLIIAIYSCAFGCFLGECLHRETKKSTMVLGGFLISFVVNMLEVTILAKIVGIDMVREMKTTYSQLISFAPQIKQVMSQSSFLNLIPLIVLMMSGLECYVMLGLTQVVMMRLKIPFPKNFHIATFSMSMPVAVIAAILLVISFAATSIYHVDSPLVWYIFYGTVLLFALQGISFLSFWCIANNHVKATAFLFLLIIVPYVVQIYSVIGMIDVFAHLRQKIYNNIEEKR